MAPNKERDLLMKYLIPALGLAGGALVVLVLLGALDYHRAHSAFITNSHVTNLHHELVKEPNR